MSDFYREYPINKINSMIKSLIYKDVVNHLEFFVGKDTSKLSVTLSPYENNRENQDNEEKSYRERYHGLHPNFNLEFLKEEILFKRHEINGNKNYINEPHFFWMLMEKLQREEKCMDILQDRGTAKKVSNEDLPTIDEDLMITLLGRAVLKMATNIEIPLDISEAPQFLEDLKKYWLHSMIPENRMCEIEGYSTTVIHEILWKTRNTNSNEVSLLGIYPMIVIQLLANKYYLEKDSRKIKTIKEGFDGENRLFHLLTFDDYYNDCYFDMSNGVYYSGVMPKVMKIEYNDQPTSSKDVKYLIFKTVRTTYATLDFMDNPVIIYHPFFKELITKDNNKNRFSVMLQMDSREDSLQEKYLYEKIKVESKDSQSQQMSIEKHIIENLNAYLINSINTNTIAVSANIITKDNYLIISKRSDESIDKGTYYCSVNGQSEFQDEHVSFYKNSVYEDMPSMDYHCKYRIDLNKEIERESIAELGISTFNQDWQYYGVSFLSINNSEYETSHDKFLKFLISCLVTEDSHYSPIKRRRMHFNVLTSNTTTYTFKEIQRNQKTATEKFENEHIKGISINIHKNSGSFMWHYIKILWKWFTKNRASIVLIYFFASYLLIPTSSSGLPAKPIIDYWRIIDLAILVVFLISSGKDLIDNYILKESLLIKNHIMDKKKFKNGQELNDYNNLLFRSFKRNWHLGPITRKLRNKENAEDKEKEIFIHAIVQLMYLLHIIDIYRSKLKKPS